jgi:VHL beta domain
MPPKNILSTCFFVIFINFVVIRAVYAEPWKSLNSLRPVELSVANYLSEEITAYWIDYKGQEIQYGKIAPKATLTQSTFETHPWVFKLNGSEYMRYRADSRPKQQVLLGLNAIGTLLKDKGEVVFQPVTVNQNFNFSLPSQTGTINLIVKPSLKISPDRAKYLHIDLDGTIVSAAIEPGNLGADTEFERGWFIEKVTTRIRSTDPSLVLFKAADISGGGESGSVTSTTSTTFSLTGSGKVGVNDKGPSGEIGGGLGFSSTVGASYTRTLKGFTVRSPVVETSEGVVTVSNDYDLTGILFAGDGGLKPYVEFKNLVNIDLPGGEDNFWNGLGSVFTTQAWRGFRLHGLPSNAKKGLQIVSQAVFNPNLPNFDRNVLLYAEVNVTLRRTWVTGETKLDAKWHTETTNMSLVKDFVVDFGFNYPTNEDF